jgi:hypothetical protein
MEIMRAQSPATALIVVVSALGGLLSLSRDARAAEGAHGVYLLGLRATGAGIMPPPGVYFSNNLYYYEGKAAANLVFPTVGGQSIANVSAKVRLDLASLAWSTPLQIFGGNLAFSGLLPIGGPVVNAGATLTSPVLPTVTAGRNDSIFSYGDPAIGASIGWHSGHFHWTVGVTGFVPIGDYREGAIANVANHRLAADVGGAITWFDPVIGLDLSAAMGVTFNKENTATNYKTGDELHLEWAATYNLDRQFSIGVVGYYYNQLTGDSGTGAILGRFKGEVTAIGGTVGYNFKLGELPVATRLKVYREFDVRNRLEGTAGYFTLSMPLYVSHIPPRSGSVPVSK